MDKRKLSNEKFVAILDSISSGEATAAIARKLKCGRDTVWKLERELPLWGWLKKHQQEGI